MTDIDEIILPLTEALQINLGKHHSIYTLPCTAEYLEELISTSLKQIGIDNDWQPNRSHAISTDLSLRDGTSVSIKSGAYDESKHTLTFSGSRLGRHGNLESMIESVIEDSADWYFCVAKRESDWTLNAANEFNKIYYFFAFECKSLPYDEIEWSSKATKSGGVTYFVDLDGFHAEIRPSMSHQLWTKVSEKRIGTPTKIVI